jgi:phosphoglycerate dehydrogenase-like enzyme
MSASSAATHLIAIHADFEAHWPFLAEALQAGWRYARLVRWARGDARPLSDNVTGLDAITHAIVLGAPVTAACLDALRGLRQAAFLPPYGGRTALPADLAERLRRRGVELIEHRSEGYWGQSVAEFGLGLTINALRRIPQYSREMLSSSEAWERYSAARNRGPNDYGAQMSDDTRFTSGTVAGKRVRVVGAGNIGSRYASFCHALGADVAAWDPIAPDPAFHRAGARRVARLEALLADAQIFAPMMPLLDATRGLVTAQHVDMLPKGCLVLVVTRMGIIDAQALRRRVLAGELALAADVFDVEPLPFDDPLLGRDNVVHTPHLAGRTVDANVAWAQALLAQFG